MSRVKIAGLALASMLVMGMALAGNATAGPLWLVCLNRGTEKGKFEESNCLTEGGTKSWESEPLHTKDKVRSVAFTLYMVDTKTALVISGMKCAKGGEGEGSVGPEGEGEVTSSKIEEPGKNCIGVGGCEQPELVEGIHLPWRTKLAEGSSEMARSTIEGTGGGAGWKIECKTALGSKTDECESEEGKPEEVLFLNEQTNGVLLVLSRFVGARKGKCTEGGKESG